MPNTTANFNIPFLDGTELVRDYPQFSEDLADAVDAGLVSARGLVAVKSAIRNTPEVFSDVASGANVAVGGLSITHEVADPANRLIISAFFGVAATTDQRARVGIAIHDGTGLINVGASPGSRTAVTAGGAVGGAINEQNVTMPSVTFVHTPGAGSKTYTVRAINARGDERTLFINRSEQDGAEAARTRGVSSLVIQEVAV